LIESTTYGLVLLVAISLPLKSDDAVLVCDLELFPTILCWRKKQLEFGLELRNVPNSSGEMIVSEFEAKTDKNTIVIAISSLREANIFKIDL
jgi:selenocysteine lyase/cysteine desulfurase